MFACHHCESVLFLGEILADIEKQSTDTSSSAAQNRASKQSINPSNGSDGTTSSTSATTTTNSNNSTLQSNHRPMQQHHNQPQHKSVRFINSEEQNEFTMNGNGNKSPIPSNKLLQPHHHQPLQIIVDTLQVPGDRSFLHSPSPNILDGPKSPAIRTPSPGAPGKHQVRANASLNGSAPKSPKSPPIVLTKSVSGWTPSPRNADASEGVPVYSVNDDNEDWNFQSYHLDYKYTPPPIKGPCCVCGDGIMGAVCSSTFLSDCAYQCNLLKCPFIYSILHPLCYLSISDGDRYPQLQVFTCHVNIFLIKNCAVCLVHINFQFFFLACLCM